MRFRLQSGLALGYKVRGVGSVVVLHHPIGLRADFWDATTEHLAANFKVVSVDARGHGDSDVPARPFTLGDMAQDTIELMRALTGPGLVIGCSMGASVAQMIAAQAPDIALGAIFANCSGPRTGGRVDLLEQRAQRAALGMPLVLEESISRWFSPGFGDRNPGIVEATKAWLLAGDPTVHSWSWRALAARSNDHYTMIRQPTLVLAGSHDAASPPASAKALARALSNVTYEEIDAGHMAPLEKPVEFAAAVARFARRITKDQE